MITNPSHKLVFGSLTLIEEGANPPDSSGVVYRVMSQETNWGNPVPVTVALLSLMRVGSDVAYDRTDNREPVLRITIEADDSDLLAQGERALQLECERANTLTWIPPDGAGLPSVFDIVWSSLELAFDDLQELLQQRVYLVRLQALPHARAEDLVVTPAIPAPTTTTYALVDNCSALSGAGFTWSATSASSTVTIDTGKVKVVGAHLGSPFYAGTQRLGAVSLTTPYLAYDISSTVPIAGVDMFGNSPPDDFTFTLAAVADLGGGTSRYFFAAPPGRTSASLLTFRVLGTYDTGVDTFWIDQVQTADAIPFLGTARQKAMSLIPGGSVRATGNLQIAHATNALGKTIVYTHPSGTGYLPPLRPWRVSSEAVTVDSTLVSGSRNATGPASTVYRLPVAVVPEGRVEVWAWLRETSSAPIARTITWDVASFMGSTLLSTNNKTTSVTFAVLNTWYLVPLGAAVSPPLLLGPSGFVSVAINGGSTVQVDEAYLFATDQGRLTIVDCATGSPAVGGPSNRLWIDGPSLDEPNGAVFRGFAADRSDAWHPGALASVWQVHDFEPTGTNVFVVTQNTIDATTSLEHYRRYHTHVASEG